MQAHITPWFKGKGTSNVSAPRIQDLTRGEVKKSDLPLIPVGRPRRQPRRQLVPVRAHQVLMQTDTELPAANPAAVPAQQRSRMEVYLLTLFKVRLGAEFERVWNTPCFSIASLSSFFFLAFPPPLPSPLSTS